MRRRQFRSRQTWQWRGDVLIGMKDLCRKNGLNEVLTHYLVGRLAMDLCDSDPPNINSVV